MNSSSNEKLLIPSEMVNNNSSSPQYISLNDFIYFKNELLKDLKKIETKLILKIDSSKKDFENKILNVEKKYDSKSKMFESIDTTNPENILIKFIPKK